MNYIDFIGGFFEEIWIGVEKKNLFKWWNCWCIGIYKFCLNDVWL